MEQMGVFNAVPYEGTTELPPPYPKGVGFPFSLAPSNSTTSAAELSDSIKNLTKSGRAQEILNAFGAIYFQNLKLETAEQFSDFAHAFGWKPHEDIGTTVRRIVHAKNVSIANEGPPTHPIYLTMSLG